MGDSRARSQARNRPRHDLPAGCHNSLVEIAHRVFAKHARSFPYNFYLGIMIIYIALYESRGPLKITTEPGETVSLPSSAIGKILLASKSDEFIRKFLAQNPLKQHSLDHH